MQTSGKTGCTNNADHGRVTPQLKGWGLSRAPTCSVSTSRFCCPCGGPAARATKWPTSSPNLLLPTLLLLLPDVPPGALMEGVTYSVLVPRLATIQVTSASPAVGSHLRLGSCLACRRRSQSISSLTETDAASLPSALEEGSPPGKSGRGCRLSSMMAPMAACRGGGPNCQSQSSWNSLRASAGPRACRTASGSLSASELACRRKKEFQAASG